MPQSISAVKKALREINGFIGKINRKEKLPTRDLESSPYFLMNSLRKCAPAFLTHPEALDLLMEFIPEIEAFRGKGSQALKSELLPIFTATVFEYQYGYSRQRDSKAPYSPSTVLPAFHKIAQFSLPRATGETTTVRSFRAANTRREYWELLTDLLEHIPLPEALPLAKQVASNKERSLPEREGAITLLLAQQDILLAKDPEAADPEIDSLLSQLRENPPSRDILFLILDAEVNSGQISEMTALFELEDWDEKNER